MVVAAPLRRQFGEGTGRGQSCDDVCDEKGVGETWFTVVKSNFRVRGHYGSVNLLS